MELLLFVFGQPAGCIIAPNNVLEPNFDSFDPRSIEFDCPPFRVATFVGNLDAIDLFAGWYAPAQICASLFRRNPCSQSSSESFTRTGIVDGTNRHHYGAGVAGAGDRIRFHAPKRQNRAASCRTAGAIGRRRLRGDNFGGADERRAIFFDLIFSGLQFVFVLSRVRFGFAHHFAWRLGRIRILFTMRSRLLGTRCGNDNRH